ncbi:MAG TPA: acyl-CoA carboxylase subunit beta [Nitrososphaerales archaeon]|nr:acyl-CoA carboxylase subunit beta [Nitrososphaerales archaeon]
MSRSREQSTSSSTAPHAEVSEKTTVERLEEMDRQAELGGGLAKIDEQHKKGKKTARERIGILLDAGSFVELDKFATTRTEGTGLTKKHYGDGVVTGYGTIEGRPVFLFAHDFTIHGGSLGETFGRKISKAMDLALKAGVPFVGLNDSGGARIQEGVQSLAAYSEIFFRNTIASGVIPQISVILGPCAGGAVYSPGITDFVIMVEKTSNMFITGPDVVKAALGEDVTFEQLGGPGVHGSSSGVSHFTVATEEGAFELVRKILSFLPQNNEELAHYVEPQDSPDREDETLDSIVPTDSNKPYDMKDVVSRIVDEGDFLEVHADWARNIIVGFARLDGFTVGIVANQPMHLAGALDIDSSDKASRFIRFCDCFNIPILTFVDVPGYLPGLDQESRGIIRHGSKLLYAYCEATVPKITTVIRKAYGGAYCAMGSKYSKADLNFAWPSAQLAVMGPEGAANIIFRKEIEKAGHNEEVRRQIVRDYTLRFSNPFIAAERGIIDAIIRPRQTRSELIKALRVLANKSEHRPPKKHGNIPL